MVGVTKGERMVGVTKAQGQWKKFDFRGQDYRLKI